MLDLRRLRLLRELAYRDTIAAVAQALSYTPSAVSQQLAILEREAGVSLLERSGRRVQLTPVALQLVTHTEAILDQLERAESSIAAAKTQPTGVLRIGAFPSAARAILPPALAVLGHDHPGLEFTVTEADPVVAADLTRTGELDVALTHDYDHVPRPDHPALTSTVVLTEPLFVAATRPPDPSGNPVASFRGAAWVLGSPGTLCRLAVERICQAAGFTPQVRHQIDDFPTALALVAAGHGGRHCAQAGHRRSAGRPDVHRVARAAPGRAHAPPRRRTAPGAGRFARCGHQGRCGSRLTRS